MRSSYFIVIDFCYGYFVMYAGFAHLHGMLFSVDFVRLCFVFVEDLDAIQVLLRWLWSTLNRQRLSRINSVFTPRG